MFGRSRKPETDVGRLERLAREEPYHIVSFHCKNRGITPQTFYGEVQKTYEATLLQDDLARMRLLREITGIALSEPLKNRIQMKYSEYARTCESDKILALREASGVPLFDNAGEKYLTNNLERELLSRDEVERSRRTA